MSPEVIRGVEYTYKADIWSLGIIALELADGEAPHFDLPPLRALFVIATQPSPTLKHPYKWSPDFNDFLKLALCKTEDGRATAEQLLQHPFILQATDTSIFGDLVTELKQAPPTPSDE